MSDNKLDKKQVLEIFKFLNVGGVLAVVVIAAVVGFMYGTGCGPVVPSSSWGETRITGAPVLEDHPEEVVAEEPHAAEAAAH